MMQTKKCLKCRLEKDLSNFTKDLSRKDGLCNNCKECASKRGRKYYEENTEKERKRRRKYVRENKQQERDRHKAYRENNKEKIRTYGRIYRREKYRNDELYRLKDITRRAVKHSFRSKNHKKESKSAEILCCTWEEFKRHLEDNPYGFMVENDNLDLDHIVPMSNAQTEEKVIEQNHYTNFQLLPSDYNRNIKKDNEFDREHFEKWLKDNSF